MQAVEYFKRMLDDGCIMAVSTIALAEYAIKDTISSLPLRNLRIIAFNYKHAEKSGLFGLTVQGCRKEYEQIGRTIVLNDSKMFAQAEVEGVDYIISADSKAEKIYNTLKEKCLVSGIYVDITTTPLTTLTETLF